MNCRSFTLGIQITDDTTSDQEFINCHKMSTTKHFDK